MMDSNVPAANCNIRYNGIDLITAATFTYGDTMSSKTAASTSVVVKMAEGDYVDIASCTDISTFDLGWKNSFSGYLLQEV